jgi:hypothetical protein
MWMIIFRYQSSGTDNCELDDIFQKFICRRRFIHLEQTYINYVSRSSSSEVDYHPHWLIISNSGLESSTEVDYHPVETAIIFSLG